MKKRRGGDQHGDGSAERMAMAFGVISPKKMMTGSAVDRVGIALRRDARRRGTR
jgi:hypothetical protein